MPACRFDLNNLGDVAMPKANRTRTRHVRNRPIVLYDDEPCEGEDGRNITISQTAAGRVLHSTSLASGLETGSSLNRDLPDPWTTGFFDSNTEAFVVDSPSDELLDFGPLKSQPEPKVRCMVWMVFTVGCSHIDKGS